MFKTRKTPSLRKTPSGRKTPSVRGKRVFNNSKMNINSSKPVLEQLFNMVFNKSYMLRIHYKNEEIIQSPNLMGKDFGNPSKKYVLKIKMKHHRGFIIYL